MSNAGEFTRRATFVATSSDRPVDQVDSGRRFLPVGRSRVRYPEYIPSEAEARTIRQQLGSAAYLWNGVCVSRTPVADDRSPLRRLLDWVRSL